MRFLIGLLAIALLIPVAVAANLSLDNSPLNNSAFGNAAANSPADLEVRRKALNDLLHERWEYTLRTSPIYASILGDKRYNCLLYTSRCV